MSWFQVKLIYFLLLPVLLISCSRRHIPRKARILKISDSRPSLVQHLSRQNLAEDTGNDSFVRVKNTRETRIALISYLKILRQEMEVISKNLANIDSAYKKDGTPSYLRKKLTSTTASSPKIVEDTTTIKKYEPDHPRANPVGYVRYSDIQPEAEMIKMIDANRQYQLTVNLLKKFDPDILIP